MLLTASQDLMPLIEEFHRTDYEILKEVFGALPASKLSMKRRKLLHGVVCDKAEALLNDAAGLTEEHIAEIQAILEKFDPRDPDEPLNEDDADEFDFLREMMESAAAQAGVDIDLSDLDHSMNPDDFERILQERLWAAAEKHDAKPSKSARKQTKAQINKAKRIKEQEDAKKRDLKSLYKQLAKALHPDLESDPTLKNHKEDWMKRLTTAYADGDLRQLLQIEMEWLGEEATNLSAAGDEKLKVYSAVLKEQIQEQKQRTNWLADEPQYSPLRRFTDPYTGKMASPTRILRDLKDNLHHLNEMLEGFRKTKSGRRALLEALADQHEHSLMRRDFF
jgi:hypothetical protein